MPDARSPIADAASSPIGTTLIALGIVYTAVIVPLNSSIATLTANRDADRKEIAGLYATLGELKGDKEFSQSRFDAIRRDIDRMDKDRDIIAAEQRSRTSLVASVPALEHRLDALITRFNDSEKRGSSSPAEEMQAVNARIERLQELVMKSAVKP